MGSGEVCVIPGHDAAGARRLRWTGDFGSARLGLMIMAGLKFDYAPAPESRAIVDIKSSYGLFIGGEFVDSVDGRPFKTISPASEEVLAEIAEAGPQDVDRAVAAARSAFGSTWCGIRGAGRAKYLNWIAEHVKESEREMYV